MPEWFLVVVSVGLLSTAFGVWEIVKVLKAIDHKLYRKWFDIPQ